MPENVNPFRPPNHPPEQFLVSGGSRLAWILLAASYLSAGAIVLLTYASLVVSYNYVPIDEVHPMSGEILGVRVSITQGLINTLSILSILAVVTMIVTAVAAYYFGATVQRVAATPVLLFSGLICLMLAAALLGIDY